MCKSGRRRYRPFCRWIRGWAEPFKGYLRSCRYSTIMMRRFFVALFLLATVAVSAFSSDSEGSVPLEELLAGYIANHREIQTLLIQLQQQELSYDSTAISQGIQVNLSTGNFSIGSSQVRGEPSLTVSMPKLNGTYVEATLPLQFDYNGATASLPAQGNASGGSSAIQGASFTIGTEIIGNSGKSSRLSMLKAERILLEAQRQIQNQTLAVEKEFYSKIKELYSSHANLLSSQDTVYTAELDLATLRVQGYSASSTRYRTKELEVLSAQRNVEKQRRILQRELELFSQKCGLVPAALSMESLASAQGILAQTGILEALPTAGIEEFTTMEAAQWNLFATQQEIQANAPLTLSAEAGYTYRNQAATGTTEADSIHGALVLQGFGGRLSGGVTLPVAGDGGSQRQTPSGQVSLSWSPNEMKTQSLQRSQRQLSLQLAQLRIQEAEEQYEEAMEDSRLTWEDLLWSRQVAQEQLPLYQQLAEDAINLYNRGMTTETEYNQAITNRDKAQIQCEIADLDLIIHDISTRQLFVQEGN